MSNEELIAQARAGKKCDACHGVGRIKMMSLLCPPEELPCLSCKGVGTVYDSLSIALADALETALNAPRSSSEASS